MSAAVQQGCPCGECRRARDWERLDASQRDGISSSTAVGRLIVFCVSLGLVLTAAAGWSSGARLWPAVLAVAAVALLARLIWMVLKHRPRTTGRQPTPALRRAARRRAGWAFTFWFAVLLSAGWTLAGYTGGDPWTWRHTLAALAGIGAAMGASRNIDTLEENR